MGADTPSRPWWALLVAVVAVAATVGLVVTDRSAASSEAAAAPMMQVAPGGEIELASLPADHRHLYEAAADDEEAFSAVRCYCGCESFLDHATLRDCFVRPEGGWERHATGCAVCLGEAGQSVVVPAGDAVTLQFPLQMHPGMDGPHHLAIPLLAGEGSGTVDVIGNFTADAKA